MKGIRALSDGCRNFVHQEQQRCRIGVEDVYQFQNELLSGIIPEMQLFVLNLADVTEGHTQLLGQLPLREFPRSSDFSDSWSETHRRFPLIDSYSSYRKLLVSFSQNSQVARTLRQKAKLSGTRRVAITGQSSPESLQKPDSTCTWSNPLEVEPVKEITTLVQKFECKEIRDG